MAYEFSWLVITRKETLKKVVSAREASTWNGR